MDIQDIKFILILIIAMVLGAIGLHAAIWFPDRKDQGWYIGQITYGVVWTGLAAWAWFKMFN